MNPVILVLAMLAGASFALFADLKRRRLTLSRRAGWHAYSVLDVVALALMASFAVALLAALTPVVLAQRALPLFSPIAVSLLVCAVAGSFLLQEGRRQVQLQRPAGLVFAEFMVLGGAYLVALRLYGASAEFPVVGSISIAWTVLPIAVGCVLIAVVVPPFVKGQEVHRILDRIADQGEFLQSEWIPSTPECAHPERWHMLDPQSAEMEVLDLLESLIKAVKPELIVETGTFIGHSAIRMAQALQANGFGKIVTIEYDPVVFAKAKQNIDASGVAAWIDNRNASSLEVTIHGAIDVLYSDSDLGIREQEVRRFLPQIKPRGLVLLHDASSHFKVVREAALRLEAEGLLSVVLLSTPRGLCLAQKREGRT